MKKPQRSVTVMGAGNWGSSLVHALTDAAVPLDEVITRTTRRSSGGKRLPVTTIGRARLGADIFWLCVPDAAIAKTTRLLVQRTKRCGSDLQGKIVVHSSGALDAGVLQAAADAGASVASVHPMMSFPTRTPVSLKGVPFGIEADIEADKATRGILSHLVRRLGGQPFAIEPAGKALYHMVGMLASPLLVAHLGAAQQAAELAGFTPRQARDLIEPIARATLDNFFVKGPMKSFSGPIARGDGSTIRLHLQALQPHPMLAGVYRSLARYGLEAFSGRNVAEMRGLLS